MAELLRITRPLRNLDQQCLRRNLPESNKLGDLSIKWRRYGEMALTLLDRGEYQRAIGKQTGRLSVADTFKLEHDFNTIYLPALSRGRLTVEACDVDFFGGGPFRSIGYVLDTPAFEEEHQAIIHKIENLTGVTSVWRDFRPHLSVATIPEANRSDDILDAFWRFVADDYRLTFERPVAQAS